MKQVTERALFERLKRKILKTDSQVLHKNRHEKYYLNAGWYYTTDLSTGSIIRKGNFDKFIKWCKEYKVLAKDEEVVDADFLSELEKIKNLQALNSELKAEIKKSRLEDKK